MRAEELRDNEAKGTVVAFVQPADVCAKYYVGIEPDQNKWPVRVTGQLQIPDRRLWFPPNSARSDQHAFSMPFFR
jgi:hypothetical protein